MIKTVINILFILCCTMGFASSTESQEKNDDFIKKFYGRPNISNCNENNTDGCVKNLLEKNFCVQCNLKQVQLKNAKIAGASLQRANLSNADFENANLKEANLTEAVLISANLENSNLDNANLEKAIEENLFRKDLYYRLKVIVFSLPPLRERKEDIPDLAEFFLKKYSSELNKPILVFDNESMSALQGYDYPGNIRELENIVERATVLAEDESIHISDLPDEIKHRKYRTSTPVVITEKTVSFRKTEKETILEILKECAWNQSMTARLLGITRNQLRYRLKKYQLTEPEKD